MSDAIFHRDGDLFVPSRFAGSPWYPDHVHGGPPTGLLARCIERYVGDPSFQLVRLTTDLFRAVPAQPLSVTVEEARRGRRIAVVQASLWADGVEVTRASAALLRRTDTGGLQPPTAIPPGPEGLPVGQGFARIREDGSQEEQPRSLRGFHTTIQVAWATAEDAPAPACWMRIPMPFVEGEEATPATRAAALADFGNAIAGRFRLEGRGGDDSYINSDVTLYMDRDPVGEWVCLQVPYRQEIAGVGHVESIWYDEQGRYGRGVEARLANPRHG